MRAVAALLILIAFAMPVQAGSADDPEVTDPLEDDVLGTGTDASNAMDIEYIFVQEAGTCGADHLYFEMKIANLLEDDQSSGPEAFKEVTFSLRGEEHVLVGEALMPAFTLDGEDVSGGIDNDLEIYFWCVPGDMVGGFAAGDIVDGMWGRAVHGSGEETDRAPDEGTGRAYVIGQDDPISADLVLPGNQSLELVNGTGSLTFEVGNNGTEEDTVHVETNVTAGWDVTVSPANQTLAAGENGTFEIAVSGDGDGPVIIGVTSELGFRGSFRIDIEHAPAPTGDGDEGQGGDGGDDGADEDGEDGADGGDDGGAGNATSEGGKDSPSPAWILIASLLSAAVVAARRRR